MVSQGDCERAERLAVSRQLAESLPVALRHPEWKNRLVRSVVSGTDRGGRRGEQERRKAHYEFIYAQNGLWQRFWQWIKSLFGS